MAPSFERRALQLAVALAALVPVAAGAWGVFSGVVPEADDRSQHVRYLSGLLLGLGLAFWWTVPSLERRGDVVRVLAGLVVAGGAARLFGALTTGAWSAGVWPPLVMELGVTPAIALWRERVERRLRE